MLFYHHVEVVDAPLLVEVGVEFEQLVAAEVRRPRILSPAAGLGVGVCLERAGVHAVVGLGARYVGLAGVRSIFSAKSPSEIFRFAIITSKFTIIGIG